ncbi:hypothetical protein MAPG_05245 [Magnaporthiopsis poae ATCC 64411]|uniref:Uncharacterized protein n=1 Tax=Magnaporthiopsis poae (strain ATCC 64411 / 73-15) TaxID=644358 RepID=A0A0C4DYW4_MAGP6|nr:hypothetical protein MAPG_05245 [Magnaporthiopsis poae ATCC 64411]
MDDGGFDGQLPDELNRSQLQPLACRERRYDRAGVGTSQKLYFNSRINGGRRCFVAGPGVDTSPQSWNDDHGCCTAAPLVAPYPAKSQGFFGSRPHPNSYPPPVLFRQAQAGCLPWQGSGRISQRPPAKSR